MTVIMMMMMVMVVMTICEVQNTFTFVLVCDHIFLAVLIKDLNENHILLTLSLYAPLFWAIPKGFDLFSVTPRTRRKKLQEDRFRSKIGRFLFKG